MSVPTRTRVRQEFDITFRNLPLVSGEGDEAFLDLTGCVIGRHAVEVRAGGGGGGRGVRHLAVVVAVIFTRSRSTWKQSAMTCANLGIKALTHFPLPPCFRWIEPS